GLVAVLDDAVGLFGLGYSGGSNFDSLHGGPQIQVRLAYLEVDRRICVLAEGFGLGLGKACLVHPGLGLAPIPQVPAKRNGGEPVHTAFTKEILPVGL